ncbi:MAG TPA: hypothetical protein VH796_18780 [Nitrososphaeraceae archaeon]|jgi:hypothetical protein
MILRHREHIFDAIKTCLLDQEFKGEQKLNYNTLYDKVNDKIKESRIEGKGISPRDFSSELKLLVEEGKIQRTEDEDSKRKIKPVYFSLTQNAKAEHRLGILGINPEQERLRRIYQLIFSYSAISPIRNISQKQMDKIKTDLERESWVHTNGTNFTEIVYRPKLPTNYFRIITREFSGVGPKGETKAFHYCKLWSFSKEEIINIKANVDRRRRNPQNSIITSFANTLSQLKEQEVDKAFDTLKENHLIMPIQDFFFNTTRFIIADETLQDLIDEIWSIHWLELDVLKNKMNYFDPPNGEEKQWLKQIYGENEAMKIIADADRHRRFLEPNKKQIESVQKNIKYISNQIYSRIAYIDAKYQTKIHEYDFPSDLIFVLGGFLQRRKIE